MPQQHAVLFDLDGTLIDPYIGISGAYRNLCITMGFPVLSDVSVRALIGPPIHEAIERQFGLHGADLDRAVTAYRDYYGAQGIHEFEPCAGINELLVDLANDGVNLAVATSKPAVYANDIIDAAGWGDVFTVVSGAELDGSRRFKADVIAWLLQQLPDKQDVVTHVGDRSEDVLGARAHEIPCIGVSWGFGSVLELETSGAVEVVDSAPALLDAVHRLIANQQDPPSNTI